MMANADTQPHRIQKSRDDIEWRPAKHYFLTIKALCDSVLNSNSHKNSKISNEISEILEKYNSHPNWQDTSATWEDAFLCERLIIELIPNKDVQIELDRRILEISKYDSDLATFYQDHLCKIFEDDEVSEVDRKISNNRGILGRIIRDLQYYENKLELRRRYASIAQFRIFIMFCCSLVCFGFIIFTIFSIYGDYNSSYSILQFIPHGYSISMTSGWLGASFFMLIQLQRNISDSGVSDLRDMWTWRMLVLRCLVGVGAASILYFFFQSGLLTGSIWPNIVDVDVINIAEGRGGENSKVAAALGFRYAPNKDFSLLVVASFLAGYSQTLVPNLLISTEERSKAA